MPGKDFRTSDSSDFPSADPFVSDDEVSQQTGNRPASGARHATPGEIFSQNFQGSENAGDFLGLDTEFEMDSGASSSIRAGIGEVAPGADLDLTTAPGTQEEQPQQPARRFYQANPTSGEDLGEEELSHDLYATEDLEAALAESPGEKRRARPLLIAGALGVGLLAVGGVLYGPDFFGGSEPAPVVNTARERQPTPKPPAGETGTEAPDPVPADPVATTGTDPVPLDPVEAPVDGDADLAAQDPDPFASRSGYEEPEGDIDLAPTLDDTLLFPDPLGTTPDPGFPLADGGDPTFGGEFPDLSGLSWAEQNELDMIWRGADVPMEAISAPAPMMMPRVGAVRVFMISGEIFEGRLYAMGQNRVWIDAEPGRIGLDGERVMRIERVLAEGELVAGTGAPVATGHRVRVSVPGGAMFGRVLLVDGDRVTLITDEGGRVTLTNAVVEPIGSSRAFVVQR
jgi:hypothetical protein